jgi:hypothetical protein
MKQHRDVLKKLLAPLAIAVVCVTAIGWYNFKWVPAEQRRLTNRYFHDLSSLGATLVARVNNFDRVLDNAWAANLRSVERLGPYLAAQVPNLTVLEEGPTGLECKAADPPGLLVEPDEGTYYLWFTFKPNEDDGKHRHSSTASRTTSKSDKNNGAIITRVSIDKLIQPKEIPEEFSTFFITRASDGDVIYQSPRQSAEANLVSDTDLTSTDAQPEANGKSETDPKAAADNKGGATATVFNIRSIRHSTVSGITLGGTNYKLFVQPIRLSYSSLVKNSQGTSHDNAERLLMAADSEVWLLCGLVQTDSLNARSLVLTDSLTSVLWFTLVAVLAIAVHPFAKLAWASPSTRLRSRDLLWQLAATVSIVAAVTFCILDLYYYGYELDRRSDGQLKGVASLIQKHFNAETTQIWKQLQDYHETLTWKTNDHLSKWVRRPTIDSSKRSCKPQEACLVDILDDKENKQDKDKDSAGHMEAYPQAYPLLQFVSWTDNQMRQRIKWTTRQIATPFLELTDVDIPFYWQALDAIKLNRSLSGVSTLLSPNTGETLTTFWMTLPREKVGKAQDEKLAMAFVATQPQSLVGPVLPGDVKFAIIDQDGRVEFHSDPGRSLNENFFRELDDDTELRSKAEMYGNSKNQSASQPSDHDPPDTFVANYRGYRQRLYAEPFSVTAPAGIQVDRAAQHMLLVVFRPLNVVETMNAQVLSEAAILFLLYAVPPGFVIALLYWRRRSRSAEWLWPTPAKAGAYVDITLVNTVCAVGLLVLIVRGTSTRSVIAVVVISFAALTFAGWRTRLTAPSLFGVTYKPLYDRAYQLAGTSLLVVTTVLPATTFFKVSEDLEQNLMRRRDCLSVEQQRLDREELISHQYADVRYPLSPDHHNVGDKSHSPAQDLDLLMQRAGVDSKWWNDATEKLCGSANDEDWPLALLPLLERFRLFYNERSAQTRALIHRRVASSTVMSGVDETSPEPLWQPWSVPPAGSGDWRSTMSWWGGSVLWIGFLYWIMTLASKRLRIGPFCSGSAQAPVLDLAGVGQLLLVGPPMSGKTEWLQAQRLRPFDLRRFTRHVGRRRESGNHTSALGNRPIDMPDWQEVLPHDITVPIVLDHFEYRIEEYAWFKQKLEALEQLIYRYKRRVIIVSSVDPLDFVTADSRTDLVQRWTSLLGMFERREFADARAGASAATSRLEAKLSVLPPEQAQVILACFDRECGLSSQVSAIGIEIVDSLPDGAPMTPETLLNDLQDRANPYYQRLWTGCTRQEKLVLVQLGEEGVLNPKSRETGERLARKRLIVSDPLPRIATETFRRFVVGAMPRATVAEWERDEKLPWADLLVIFIVAFTIFLFFTQQEVAKAWLAYIVAAAGAIPALFGALGGIRSGAAKMPDKAASA